MSRPKRSPGLRGLLESALHEQERALKILDKAPFRADAVIVDKDLRLHSNEGMRKRLVMRAELADGKLPPGVSP